MINNFYTCIILVLCRLYIYHKIIRDLILLAYSKPQPNSLSPRNKLLHNNHIFQIRIEAYDLGTPTTLSSDLDLTVYVSNMNDYQPQFLIDEFYVNFTGKNKYYSYY